ncbi:hypothetical protein GO986_14820 [Deinococcus sp. HMF7620]|uniref:VCBS repeat-containing protein n=1 Tax=Deinococcus arboris TaxID=2682977 RepID=A0A7C9M7N3_9DEIO|nr:hypothetical protein [Deinococcus arboris]MVN88025.1 hypothetical protein [Deinococcus arboris]
MRLLIPALLLLLPATAAPVAKVYPVLAALPGQATPYFLGAWAGDRWLDPDAARARLTGQETYTRLALGQAPQTVRGQKPATLDSPCEWASEVAVRPAAQLALSTLFVAGGMRAQPRPVTVLPNTNAVYASLVRAELVRRGLQNPNVRITRLVRADVDGNGTQEVIIEASRFAERSSESPPPVGQPGDYSLLLLRHVAGSGVKTVTLGAHVAPLKPWDPGSDVPMPMANLYRLVGLADLNGDSRMEIAVQAAYYEGVGVGVAEWKPSGLRQTPLESGCGV